MSGQYDNLPPSVPQSPQDSFDTIVALSKSLQEGMDKFYSLVAYLDQFAPQLLTDVNGRSFEALAMLVGSGILPQNASILHDLSIIDASSGSSPGIQVTPGMLGGIIPTIGGNPINVKIGTPLAYPVLTVGSSDTVAWLHSTINTSDGSISSTSPAIPVQSGTTVPTNTATDFYLAISTFTVVFDVSGNASVISADDNLSGSQAYQFCGFLPTTDMSFWTSCYLNGLV